MAISCCLKATVVVVVLTMIVAIRGALSGSHVYIPGMLPVEHFDGERVNIIVNSLRSLMTVVPYDYYHLPFCRSAQVQGASAESIGQILAGDRMETSVYNPLLRVNQTCVKVQCSAGNNAEVVKRADEITKFIEQGYRGHMSIDNLEGFNERLEIYSDRCKSAPPKNWLDRRHAGYAIGVPSWCTGKTLLNNHLELTIKYHQADPDVKTYRIVGFNIVPRSIAFKGDDSCNEAFDVNSGLHQPLEMDAVKAGQQTVTWTYSVTWIEDPVTTWATRWDPYLDTSVADHNGRVHLKYIISSLLITLCLSVIAGMLTRTLYKECNEYNARFNSEDPDALAEEMGWKLVHADVFRTPRYPRVLAIAMGNGLQFMLVASATLVFALLGFLSPANRGGLITSLLITFAIFSMASGYVTARVLKTMDKKEWKVIFGSAMMFPGSLFATFLLIDLVNWHLGASDAVPFKNIALLVLLWFGSCIPLNILGAAYGFHQEGLAHPCAVGRLPREIPVQRWWLSAPALYIIPATFPFCAIFLELRFIFDSLWLGSVYYAFTFLTISFFVWVVTVMLTTVIMVYYLLAYGDYRWQWHSFFVGGGMGFHVMLYSVYFFFTTATISSKTGTFIFFMYMGFFSFAYGLAAGAIGFLTSYVFVRKLYLELAAQNELAVEPTQDEIPVSSSETFVNRCSPSHCGREACSAPATVEEAKHEDAAVAEDSC
jgi:transmembrane 9 superfamily protein 2/4